MSKPIQLSVNAPDEGSEKPDNLEAPAPQLEPDPRLKRLEALLKSKAQQPQLNNQGNRPQGQRGHSKLKERVRRRP